jgi:hypothetical protein
VITVDGSLIFIADPRAPAKLSSLQKSFLVLEQKSHYFEIVKNRQNNFLPINGKQSLFVRNSHGKITLKKSLTSQYLVDFVERHFFGVRRAPCTSIRRCSLLGDINDFAN